MTAISLVLAINHYHNNKVSDRGRGGPEGFLFNRYSALPYSEVLIY